MGRLVAIVVLIAAVGGGAYYFLMGGSSGMSDEEVAAYLSGMAEEINAGEDGIKYDDFSRLANAVHVEKQITIRGNSLLASADLTEGYLESREMQAVSKLCNDEQGKAALMGGATFVYNWWSADDGDIGMVTVRGAEVCN